MAEVPQYTETKKEVPKQNKKKIPIPQKTESKKPSPQFTIQEIPAPEYKEQNIPAPLSGHPQNQVVIDGVLVQIQSTKLKYHRDQTSDFYRIIQQAPVVQILKLDDNFFGNKTPDKLLFDWLVAVIDDPDFVTQHYDNFTSKNIDDLLQIFMRLNGFKQREERKKRLAQVETKNR